ncbi:PEGA domain-containing protein [Vibrio viridaestus]|uniref:PEGA domain-containing protein n=1 Tax=Vibrio viridaestus TaxID=2487322 RepID=A0A3N9U9U2_9VIBR|nr:PEGA domain-containing protein [Vibrio viridaestus]RQW65046.1 PEGA domain-containing protein [Vibrio viridaestus]
MIIRHIPALMLALNPVWVTTSVHAEEATVSQVDPVAAIDSKMSDKKGEIDNLSSQYDKEVGNLQQLKNEREKLERASNELDAKKNRAKAALDKQYSRLLEDPDTDLATFQKQYQQAWADVKENQSELLDNEQASAESSMKLSQLKQRLGRLNSEYENLKESRVDARVKRLNAELSESGVITSSYKTTCSTAMTLGDCSNQGLYLTKQQAVSNFRDKLLNNLTESVVAKQNLKGVQLNLRVTDSQTLQSGFQGNNDYFAEIQAQIQARPEATAACELLNVSTRYCLNGQEVVAQQHKAEKKWASITVRSDQYDDSVTIDGVNYGSTPVDISVPFGLHKITVSKSGYETYNKSVTISANDTIWIKLRPRKDG